MVQAILDGSKTQTRRIKGLEEVNYNPDEWIYDGFEFGLHHFKLSYSTGHHPQINERKPTIKCPYGELGDVLWVRETWQTLGDQYGEGIEYAYKADIKEDDKFSEGLIWKPSIHMPKAACRIFLKVKSIRVERLQDISEEDAEAEGVMPCTLNSQTGNYCYKYGFIKIWHQINGEASWNTNPFVWVIEFERCEKPETFLA